MTVEVRIGHGTLFKSGDGSSPETFTTLAYVTNVGGPSIARDSIDASHTQSPNQWREFIAGMKDAGEVSIDLDFVTDGNSPSTSNSAVLMAEFSNDGSAATKNRQIVFPNGAIWSFSAFLTAFEPAAPVADKVTASATFKITGQPTLAQN